MAAVISPDSSTSFAAFARKHRDDLVRVAGRIVGNSTEAEDVVQDTLMALWRNWQDEPPQRLAAYAYRAVKLNAMKRQLRRRTTATLEAVDPIAKPREAPLDAVEFESAIARLPLPQQTVVRMRFYLGLSLAQIGRSLSISSNTAASRCRYALAALKVSLRGFRN